MKGEWLAGSQDQQLWSFKLRFFAVLCFDMSCFSCLELKNDLLNWQTSHPRHNLNRITKYIVPLHSHSLFKFSWNKVRGAPPERAWLHLFITVWIVLVKSCVFFKYYQKLNSLFLVFYSLKIHIDHSLVILCCLVGVLQRSAQWWFHSF